MDRRRDGARGTDARQVDAQVGYAFKPFGEDVAVAPYAEYSTGGGTLGNSPRVGWRVSALESFRLALEYDLPGFGRREQERHGVTLRGSFSR